MAEAFSREEMHGYLTFLSNDVAMAACAVVIAALGAIAPQPGQLPAAVRCVHCDVTCGLIVYTRNDAPAGGRKAAHPTQAAPPRAIHPPLMEADVRRLIADLVRQLPQEQPTQVEEPTQRSVADTLWKWTPLRWASSLRSRVPSQRPWPTPNQQMAGLRPHRPHNAPGRQPPQRRKAPRTSQSWHGATSAAFGDPVHSTACPPIGQHEARPQRWGYA